MIHGDTQIYIYIYVYIGTTKRIIVDEGWYIINQWIPSYIIICLYPQIDKSTKTFYLLGDCHFHQPLGFPKMAPMGMDQRLDIFKTALFCKRVRHSACGRPFFPSASHARPWCSKELLGIDRCYTEIFASFTVDFSTIIPSLCLFLLQLRQLYPIKSHSCH